MGLISGVVTYRDGQPSTLSQISAAVGGRGGRTLVVRTDCQGRFVLRWEGDGDADALYCDGKEVARNVRDGTETVHIVIG
jgi:hypothetical protein